MHGSNKFLIGIVIGIILLTVITFSLVMLRPEPTYLDDSTPAGAAHNYLLALQQGDFERAYQYIPPSYQAPANADELARQVRDNPWRFGVDEGASLSIQSTEF